MVRIPVCFYSFFNNMRSNIAGYKCIYFQHLLGEGRTLKQGIAVSYIISNTLILMRLISPWNVLDTTMNVQG